MASQKRHNGVKQSSDLSNLRKGYDRVSNFVGGEYDTRLLKHEGGKVLSIKDRLIILPNVGPKTADDFDFVVEPTPGPTTPDNQITNDFPYTLPMTL